MKVLNSTIGGIAGALALNILHETARRIDPDAPRVDLVGEEALTKSVDSFGGDPPTGKALYNATLISDIVSNSMYYSLIGAGKPKHVVLRGIAYGAAAGLGALTLTKPLGLDDTPVTKTNKTKALTVAWYLFGGLVAGLTIQALQRRKGL